ncbi:MAG: MgtC/SapB family protein [Phycisphaerales bacterium]
MELSTFHELGIALGLGLLVGLQREMADKDIAGIRTFSLIALLGATTMLLAELYGGWVIGAGFLAVAAMVFLGNLALFQQGFPHAGVTTEVAALMMFAVGAAVMTDYTAEAVVLGGVVAILLHWKEPLHAIVDRIGEADAKAIMRFVLIALVILPLIPNETYGPYDVINPFKIWLMVVLIVGISLVAYIIYRLLGAKVGTILGGVLGGFISSTATTVSYARDTKNQPELAPRAGVVIVIASTVVYVRVLFEIAVVARSTLPELAPPLAVMGGIMTLISVAGFLTMRGSLAAEADYEAPSNLVSAIIFGLLYAAVLLGVAFAKDRLGEEALYVVAFLSGLTDMDAITLSTAQLVQSGQVESDTGWRLILVGSLANLVFKAIAVAALGGMALLWRVSILFGLAIVAGVALLFLWPA